MDSGHNWIALISREILDKSMPILYYYLLSSVEKKIPYDSAKNCYDMTLVREKQKPRQLETCWYESCTARYWQSCDTYEEDLPQQQPRSPYLEPENERMKKQPAYNECNINRFNIHFNIIWELNRKTLPIFNFTFEVRQFIVSTFSVYWILYSKIFFKNPHIIFGQFTVYAILSLVKIWSRSGQMPGLDYISKLTEKNHSHIVEGFRQKKELIRGTQWK